MIDLLKELTTQIRLVTSESFHEMNRKATVTYPYLTFDFDSEAIERNVDGFYIDVDIFDNNSSYMRVFELEEALKEHFKDNRLLTDEVFVRFNFLRSNKVQTGDDVIKRRSLQFYCKVDWRNK